MQSAFVSYPVHFRAHQIQTAMTLDIFIIAILLWAGFNGWKKGLLKELISMGGFLLGLLIAATCYSTLGEYLTVNGSQVNMLTSIVAFLILWIIVPIALGFVATMLTKTLKGMKLGTPNSILGLLVSVLKYGLLLSCLLSAMNALGLLSQEKIAGSHLYKPTTSIVSFILEHGITQSDDKQDQKADTTWVDMQPAADAAKQSSKKH